MSSIKECFASRWGEHGWLVEADYSQLEVICLAFIANDKQLLSDLEKGVDIHSVNAAKLLGVSYETFFTNYKNGDTEAQVFRRAAKTMSFQLQYGSGAKNMSESTGLPVDTCKAFIDNYYTRYNGIKKFHDDIINAAARSRVLSDRRSKKGLPVGVSRLKNMDTKREYTFYEEDAPDYMKKKGKDVSFRPTKLKNYPVQGFATGDLVPMMLGELFFVLKNNSVLSDKCLLINTIHDSILFDVHEEVLGEAIEVIRKTLLNTKAYLKAYFDIDFPIPLPIEIKKGKNWGGMYTVGLTTEF